MPHSSVKYSVSCMLSHLRHLRCPYRRNDDCCDHESVYCIPSAYTCSMSGVACMQNCLWSSTSQSMAYSRGWMVWLNCHHESVRDKLLGLTFWVHFLNIRVGELYWFIEGLSFVCDSCFEFPNQALVVCGSSSVSQAGFVSQESEQCLTALYDGLEEEPCDRYSFGDSLGIIADHSDYFFLDIPWPRCDSCIVW